MEVAVSEDVAPGPRHKGILDSCWFVEWVGRKIGEGCRCNSGRFDREKMSCEMTQARGDGEGV